MSVSISGHRGAPESAPENTLSAFRAAVELGVDVIETDVHLSADNHVVVAHDPTFLRLGGPDKLIRNCSRKELEGFVLADGLEGAEKPLFMDKALSMFPEARFNVDLKDSRPEMARAWYSLLKEKNAARRCRTATFHDRSLRYFRRLAPDFPVGVPRAAFTWLLILSFFGLSRKPTAVEEILQIPEKVGPLRIISPRTLRLWHRYGWKIEAWTIDNECDMARLVDWGVDGIITNRPSLLKKLLNR